MSEYNELFLAPKTTQYGSHMIMSNVSKPTKTKYINIDTKFRDEYNYLQTTDYNITLPERIPDVKNMSIVSMELPITFCNISSSLGNNSFQISDTINNYHTHLIIIPDGNYSQISLVNTINKLFDDFGTIEPNVNNDLPDHSDLRCVISGNNCKFYSNNATFVIDFTVNDKGILDKYNFRYKLGWLLGFRKPTYTIDGTREVGAPGNPATDLYGPYGQLVYTSEQFIDLTGPRYLYLAIEEFNKGNQNSFVSPIAGSFINKNIVARISLDNATHGYGTVLPVNKLNGLLISDKRSYTGKIDLLKLNIKLLSENGNIISLNGYDFSFCLEVEHE